MKDKSLEEKVNPTDPKVVWKKWDELTREEQLIRSHWKSRKVQLVEGKLLREVEPLPKRKENDKH
jgi:hypothetical protein